MSTATSSPPPPPSQTYFDNTTAPRIDTDALVFKSIQAAHPNSTITIVPEFSCPLKAWAVSDPSSRATITPLSPSDTLSWTLFIPPRRRLDEGTGFLARETFYEKFLLSYANTDFLVYFADGRDGTSPYVVIRNQYIVSDSSSTGVVAALLRACGSWASSLHEEIWVFQQGYWDKDPDLYRSIMKSSWDNVILHREQKEDLVDTITRFYDSRETYHKLGVPWKRGIIFYGPPGNGKTISIKATMGTLYRRKNNGGPIPTLYVKSFTSFFGPEFSVNAIFEKARKEAPCYLVFEDLDSMVSDDVRSYFLNAVDGLSENEGILMVGSTNHLDRLDPGIAKRPSRFDRKYLFDDPDESLRERYAEFWRNKVLDRAGESESSGMQKDKDPMIEFPKFLCKEIAKITDGFSFAYMQEAFVSALLNIANDQKHEGHLRGLDRQEMKRLSQQWELLELSDDEPDLTAKTGKDGKGGDGKDLEKYILWREIKQQIDMLRKEMDKDRQL